MNRSPSVSRRRFLRNSAAATMAVPYLIPSGLLAAEGRPGPNDRIGIAGIGVGRQGGWKFLSASRYDISRPVAVADANLVRGKQIAKEASETTEVYQDYRKLLERKDVDAITTATPDHWRSLVCIHACQAGKDVYAEKPMTLTVREGRLMVQAARKYGRVFQTGSQQRSQAANRYGCELVRNGRLGKIHTVIGSNYPSPWECALPAQPVPAGLDWDLWCGPNELVPYHIDLCSPRTKPGWISFRPYSGGEMTGWGAHGLDQVQWALGMDASGPVEIWTEGPKFDPPTYTEPEGRGRGEKACRSPMVFFRYAGGVTLKLDTATRAARSSSATRARSKSSAAASPPIRPAWSKNRSATMKSISPRATTTCSTGFSASRRAKSRSPTSRPVTDRRPYATSATSPGWSAASSAGTRRRRPSSATPPPTSISIVRGGSRMSFRRRFEISHCCPPHAGRDSHPTDAASLASRVLRPTCNDFAPLLVSVGSGDIRRRKQRGDKGLRIVAQIFSPKGKQLPGLMAASPCPHITYARICPFQTAAFRGLSRPALVSQVVV